VWYNFCIIYPFDQLDFGISLCVIMDSLPPKTHEQLKKMSFTCLIAKLGKAGYDPDRVVDLEKADLLEALAETMLVEPAPEPVSDFVREAREASQVSLPARDSSSATSEGGSAAVRLRELELEEKRAEREKRQAEREKRKAAREADEKKLIGRPKELLWKLKKRGEQ